MKFFTVPGISGSDNNHWQTLWEERYGYERIEQDDWHNPDFIKWEKRLVEFLEKKSDINETILISHSMGSLLTVKSLEKIRKFLKGIFLVAPPSPFDPEFPKASKGFESLPENKLDIKGILIYSENDRYATPDFYERYARIWGITPINIGKAGHINSTSNLGYWDTGFKILSDFIKTLD